ncbi:hypothetical protein Lal_00011185 [Lupinus albus]|nr:hypothetical protein Lal_00011185 [Lupinus albus]
MVLIRLRGIDLPYVVLIRLCGIDLSYVVLIRLCGIDLPYVILILPCGINLSHVGTKSLGAIFAPSFPAEVATAWPQDVVPNSKFLSAVVLFNGDSEDEGKEIPNLFNGDSGGDKPQWWFFREELRIHLCFANRVIVVCIPLRFEGAALGDISATVRVINYWSPCKLHLPLTVAP